MGIRFRGSGRDLELARTRLSVVLHMTTWSASDRLARVGERLIPEGRPSGRFLPTTRTAPKLSRSRSTTGTF